MYSQKFDISRQVVLSMHESLPEKNRERKEIDDASPLGFI